MTLTILWFDFCTLRSVHPGGEGVIVAASGTQRGFTPADQAWIAIMAQKLDQTLSGEERA
jgi:hypothetical protein